MRTVKNVTFVTNLQQGTCLLFERKKLRYSQIQKSRDLPLIKSLINRLLINRLQFS